MCVFLMTTPSHPNGCTFQSAGFLMVSPSMVKSLHMNGSMLRGPRGGNPSGTPSGTFLAAFCVDHHHPPPSMVPPPSSVMCSAPTSDPISGESEQPFVCLPVFGSVMLSLPSCGIQPGLVPRPYLAYWYTGCTRQGIAPHAPHAPHAVSDAPTKTQAAGKGVVALAF